MTKINLHTGIFIIEDFFNSQECESYANLASSCKFEEAKVNIGGKQTMLKGVRNNERHLFFDEQLGNQLWGKLKDFVEPEQGTYEAFGLNEMFRIYKYSKGQRFKMHRDGSYVRNEKECSFYSFLIYLNDDFEGGETQFENNCTIKPKKGTALIFEHPLRHEGKRLISGQKYVLRTDIMYREKD